MPRIGRGPRLDWRKERWFIRWTENGCTRERSTGSTDRREAESQLADFLAERRERPVGRRREAAYLVTDLIAEYADEHGPTLRSDTLTYLIKPLVSWWVGKSVADILKHNCQAYADHRLAQGVSSSTVRRELGVVSAAVGHARSNDRLREQPKVWMPEDGPARERWLTRKEAAGLLRAARSSIQARGHLPLFILLGLYGGARKGAILDLQWSQIDLERGRIDWSPAGRAQTKKRRPKTPIPRRLITFLRLAKRRSGGDLGPVLFQIVKDEGGIERAAPFGDIKKGFAKACVDAGLMGVTPHTLRHTAGTWRAQAGVPMWEIAGFLGHSVQRTTELYAHHHPDFMERARDAY